VDLGGATRLSSETGSGCAIVTSIRHCAERIAGDQSMLLVHRMQGEQFVAARADNRRVGLLFSQVQ
jgi:hypothetical protein